MAYRRFIFIVFFAGLIPWSASAQTLDQCRLITQRDAAEISCNPGEIIVSGGGTCHSEWDEHVAESKPTSLLTLSVKCVNHHNSGIVHAPAVINAVCCPSSMIPDARFTSSNDQATISCGNDLMAFGGASCHYGDWDERLVKSLPSPDNPANGMDFMCANRTNSGIQHPPASLSAVCFKGDTRQVQNWKTADTKTFPAKLRPSYCNPDCRTSTRAVNVLLNSGAECNIGWDQMQTINQPVSRQASWATCMNHQDSNRRDYPAGTNGICYGPTNPPSISLPVHPDNAPDWVENAVKRYAPVFVLHPDESYWPVDPPQYIATSSVFSSPNGPDTSRFTECDDKLDSIGQLSKPEQRLATYLMPIVNRRDVIEVMGVIPLVGSNANWADCSVLPILCGSVFRPSVDELNKMPVFAIISDKPEINAVDVYYWAFFGYNQGKGFADTSYGNHFGDWVHASIRFDRSTGKPIMLFMDHHGNDDDYSRRSWSEAGKPVNSGVGFQVTSDGRPIVYLAQGSHEVYPSPGSWDLAKGRLFNIYDYTADGKHWDTSVSLQLEWIVDGKVLSKQGNNWLNYNGRYGIPQGGRCDFGQCQREAGAPSPSPSERAFMTDNGQLK